MQYEERVYCFGRGCTTGRVTYAVHRDGGQYDEIVCSMRRVCAE